jgi:hypothetical protein
VIRWIQRLFRNRALDQQLDAELRFHVEQQTADLVAAGVNPREARRRALIDLGGFEQTKQKCRDVDWENDLESLYRDFRFAFRSLKKDRRFTFVAILTLALGIGSTTLIFSVIDCVVFHPFPYKNSGRLASFNILLPEQVTLSRFPVPAFLDFKEQNHVVEDMFGLAFLSVRYAGRNRSDRFLGGWATSNTFDVLGVKTQKKPNPGLYGHRHRCTCKHRTDALSRQPTLGYFGHRPLDLQRGCRLHYYGWTRCLLFPRPEGFASRSADHPPL